MPRLYQKTDVKNPTNQYGLIPRPMKLGSKFTDFQKFSYYMQLGEQEFRNKDEGEKSNFSVWVRDTESYENQLLELEEYFTTIFEFDVSITIEKDNSETKDVQRFIEPEYDFICLFSGGLDSASYALHSKLENKRGILHHSITNEIAYGKAKKIYQNNFLGFGLFFTSTRIENKVTQPGYLKSRGNIFLTNLLAVGGHLNVKRAIIPENGPFMINLPIYAGAEPTRTTDPQMLEDWTNIFNKIMNTNILIETPFINNTKSEVILLGRSNQLIKDSWSCSYYQSLKHMCGLCNSCLVRILSCYAIDEGENLEKNYMTNVFTTRFQKLKEFHRNSYRVSLHASNYWACIIQPELAVTQIEKENFERINETYPVMTNHALDMYLGFYNIKKKYFSLEPIFNFFDANLKKIDPEKLKNRFCELEKLKERSKWKD